MGDGAPHAFADFADFEAVARGHLGYFLGGDAEEHDDFVEDLVGFDVMEQDEGSAAGISGHENTRAADADDVLAGGDVAQLSLGDFVGVDFAENFRLPGFPRVHDGDDRCGNGDREPAAVHEFVQRGDEEDRIDAHKDSAEGEGAPEGPFPRVAHHDVKRVGCDDHRAGDRDAVGGGEAVARTKVEDDGNRGEREGGVDQRHINLTDLVGIGVCDRQPGKVAELNR